MSVVTREPVAAARPEPAARQRRRRRGDVASKTVSYAILIVGAVVCIAPFAWMVVASLQPIGEMFSWPPHWIPRHATLDNYRNFLNPPSAGNVDLVKPQPLRWFLNSAFVAVSVTALQLFFNSLAAYAFAKRRFPGRDAFFLITLGTLMIPGAINLVPQYMVLRHIPLFGGNDIWGNGGHGWLDSYWALIVPGAVSSFGIFLLRQYMRSIPDDLLDAARIDGAGEFRIFWRIVLPLTRPALAALGIFTFSYVWDDFTWPLIVVNSADLDTMPLGLAMFVVQNRTAWDYVFAGSVITTIPVIIMFLLFQRHFVKGIAITGMK